ncbi:hypothetical protein NPIL_229671 [Nephila pilipes]|uniref:Uncharacterized protein n=1 Tax=Nephila pilipes TaxID=299642 RepID=A0A8X6QSI5_NEPPI|nr:hypothetical protein NPIL_229671 [Nephila pilipes]
MELYPVENRGDGPPRVSDQESIRRTTRHDQNITISSKHHDKHAMQPKHWVPSTKTRLSWHEGLGLYCIGKEYNSVSRGRYGEERNIGVRKVPTQQQEERKRPFSL